MEQDVDVTTRDAEDRRDVFTVALLQHAQHHHRTLRPAETFDTRSKADVFLCLHEQVLDRLSLRCGLDRFDRVVSSCDVVPAPSVPGEVSGDRDDVRGPGGPVGGDLVALELLEERRERLLRTLDRVLRRETFMTRDANERPTLVADEVGQGGDGIHHGGSIQRLGAGGGVSYNFDAFVRNTVADTFSGMSKSLRTVTEQTFAAEVLSSPLPVLLDFGAEWCAPCRALEPVLEKIAERHGDRVRVLAIDADECAAIAARYKVRALPTIVSFVGGQEHKRHTGSTSMDVLLGLLPAEVGATG